jgi:hypothetical protein
LFILQSEISNFQVTSSALHISIQTIQSTKIMIGNTSMTNLVYKMSPPPPSDYSEKVGGPPSRIFQNTITFENCLLEKVLIYTLVHSEKVASIADEMQLNGEHSHSCPIS